MATQKKTEEVVEQTTPVEQTQEPQSNVGAAQVTATPTQTPATQTPTAEQNQQATQESAQQTTQQTTTQTAAPQTSYTQKITIKSPEVDPLEHLDTTTMEDQINKWFETSKQQQENRIDYGTNQGITELERAKEDAQEQFQTQRNQVDIDEAKALDNQALYAEARGDKGGIGQAQYNQIQNAAATNRMTVNKAQTKLATDTARQLADLRAQGEFQKADAVLTLTQNYLSQLFQLGQWAAEFNLSVDQFNASLRQWSAEYEMGMAELGMAQDQWQWQVGQAEKENLANAGWAILDAGIMPSESQLAAMGLTPQQATDLLNTRKLSGGTPPTPEDPYKWARETITGEDTEDSYNETNDDATWVMNTLTADVVNGMSGINPMDGKPTQAWTTAEAVTYLAPYVQAGAISSAGAAALVNKVYQNLREDN